ncbi:MAG: 3'-5' exonuclease [Acidovorax sp.]|uniref:3'-5' exonuclease n=1 Tax=Acidovorax sp. TaxID=1872122 RepID=UPI0022BDE192|nr:3'-5' exonuclease [Acidovorax sp.]MCZ8220034.1 3'-5' exonuclease [Acidovorax sp.]
MVPLEITKLTGISDGMLKDAPPISEVLPRALEVIGRRTIAAYNAPFDMGFLETECRRLGLALSNPSFCVMQQAQSVLGYLPGGFKLANVADVLGVQQVGPSHRAEADATLALNVALAIWDGQLPYGREKLDIKLVCEIHTFGRLVPPPVIVWEAECAPILRNVVDQVGCSVWTRDRSDYINVYGPEGGYGEGVIARIYKNENPELAAIIRTGEEVECIAKKVGNDAFEVHLSCRSR